MKLKTYDIMKFTNLQTKFSNRPNVVGERIQMKISAINNVNVYPQFKSSVNNTNSTVTPPQDNSKKNLALAALAVTGIAIVGLAAKKKGVKNIIHSLTTSKKRDAKALERYRYDEATRKMESLNKRILSGEFKDKSPEALEKIKRNDILFKYQLGFVR